MKKLFIFTLTSLLMAACTEDSEFGNNSGRYIVFNVTDNNVLSEPEVTTRSSATSTFDGAEAFVPQNSLFNSTTIEGINLAFTQTPIESDLDEDLVMTTTIEKGIHHPKQAATRGAQVVTGGTFGFGVSEYQSDGTTAVASFQNEQFTGVSAQPSSAQTVHSGKTWESNATSNAYKFYAYSPTLTTGTPSNGLTLQTGNKTITYDCTSVAVANQQDLMTAYASSNYNKDGVALAFGHRLCAVKIQLGASWNTNYTIQSVSFSSVVKSGTLSLADGSWGSKGAAGAYTPSGITNASAANGTVAVYLMMVPQTLSSCVLTVSIRKSGDSFDTVLKTTLSTVWNAGETVTYTISPSTISTVTVNYPLGTNGWSDGSSGHIDGPVTAYTASDHFGLFAVDKDGKIVISNLDLTSTASATPSITLPSGYIYSSQYTYYLYYPYQSDLITNTSKYNAGGLAKGQTYSGASNADTFFANVTAGWTVQTDQSTASAANYKASDLQVAKCAPASSAATFQMSHQMGLLKATIPAAAVADNVIVYNGNTYNSGASGEKWTRITAECTTTTWNASTTFTSSTHKPYKDTANGLLYFVAKPSDATITISATSGTQLYAWSVSGSSTTVSTKKYYKTFSIATPDYSNAYIKKIWKFSYSGSPKQWVSPVAGYYILECWGAQGASYTASGYTSTGGKGAYVKGKANLTSSKTLYVYVGQCPSSYQGGWNGGGTNTAGLPSGGGGATDISLRNGNWNSDTHLYSRIIVAGGGGGGAMEVAPNTWNGGNGGAWAGTDGQGQDPGHGGQLNGPGANGDALMAPTAASFGSGGSGGWGASQPSEPLGAGGGGWYGGGTAGGGGNNGGGGGGSSYAWSTTDNLHTYYPASSYKPTTSDYLTDLSKTAGSRTGNGEAKITYTKP